MVPEYVREPVPGVWLQPLPLPSLDGTYADYIAECEQALATGNADKRSIEEWQRDD